MAENLLEDGVLFILLEVGHVKLHFRNFSPSLSVILPFPSFFFFFSLVWLKT